MKRTSSLDTIAAAVPSTSKSQIPDGLILGRELHMDLTVDLLLREAKSNEHWQELYQRAVSVLESLPLATGDFSLAMQRLANARCYASREVYGAATFELRGLSGKVST